MSTLYFAYGSNMSRPQMSRRVPRSRLLGPGWLPGYELIFTGHSRNWGGAVASILPKRRSRVFGLLYQLPPGGFDLLDRFEGYPHVYDRAIATVETSEGQVDAVVYFRPVAEPGGQPSDAYLRIIVDAYAKYGVELP